MKFEKPGHYNAADRAKIPDADFAGPDRTFPIEEPKDISDAADLVGHADDPTAVKARIVEIAKRKGKEYAAKLPEGWVGDTAFADFNNQWVEIFAAGNQRDREGRTHSITADYLDKVVSNYATELHEAPAVAGHPADDDSTPAYGWVKGLRRNGDRLEARFAQVEPAFEGLVEQGRFKKRSASFYLDNETAPGGKAPYLRHVGFLGASAPAVKGLKDIRFAEGRTVSFVSEFGEEDTMDEKQIEGVIARTLKKIFGGSDPEGGSRPSSFSEGDVRKMIADAVGDAKKEVTASFSEKIGGLEKANVELVKQVESQSTRATRADLVAFAEGLGKAKFPPAFKAMGVIDFMESLAAGNKKVTVVTFSEKDGQKVETKTESTQLAWFKGFLSGLGPFISFGESFGGLNAVGAQGSDVRMIDPEKHGDLRESMGMSREPAKKS